MKEVPFTQEEFEKITQELNKNLGPEWLCTRSGPSGRVTYIEGKTAIGIANDIFGFNGWNSEIKETTIDFVDVEENGRVNIGISVTIRITLKDGSFHEDIGYGASENAKTKAAAYEKARKQAVTDAIKRALRNFGNALGNCLYDKNYLNNISKMAHPQIKFSPKNLYRHSQFQQPKTAAIEHHSPSDKELNNVNQNDKIPLLMPEDSFSYEGDDAALVQMVVEQEFKSNEGNEEELGGIVTQIQNNTALSIEQKPNINNKREPRSLSDNEETSNSSKKLKTSSQ